MATNVVKAEAKAAPKQGWFLPVLMTWIIPGSGYFFLKKGVRGGLMAGTSVLMFVIGLMMRGTFFEWQTGDLLTTVIYGGGYICHLCSGSLYLLANALNYSAPDVANHTVDYGTKFLVGAGLVNVLSMVDVYEIASGKKD
jgi:hypothetical protein